MVVDLRLNLSLQVFKLNLIIRKQIHRAIHAVTWIQVHVYPANYSANKFKYLATN